jgi:cyclopropane-fatty-acyl-phospholipid synthase
VVEATDAVALALLGRLIREGSLDVTLPDGRRRTLRGPRPGPHAAVEIHRPGVGPRVVMGGDIGLAETYMDGDLTTPDLPTLVELATRNLNRWQRRGAARPLQRLLYALKSVRLRARPRGGVASTAAHYELGNDFYRLWLDRTMTYSSAVFDRTDQTLEEAQSAKYRRLAEATDLRGGHRVLEIGSGWGAFAVFAARDLGCPVTTVTISREQHAFVSDLVRREGLGDRVDVRLEDYRHIEGTFDRVVSIEMIESIPEEQWPGYFNGIHRLLRSNGRAGLQIIVMADEFWEPSRGNEHFIGRYIFPGCGIPATRVLRRLASEAGLRWRSEQAFGHSYARTLAEWRRRFESAWPLIAEMGFDDRFRRMWECYLSFCEGGFRGGRLDVKQIVLER